EGDVERQTGLLPDCGIAPEDDHVVAHADHLLRVGAEVVPPALAERVEDRRAHGRHAVVDAAVRKALRLVPLDVVVHHRERGVEVVTVERLVRVSDGLDVHETVASTSSGCASASVTSHTCWTTPFASTQKVK